MIAPPKAPVDDRGVDIALAHRNQQMHDLDMFDAWRFSREPGGEPDVLR
jgi:hypothetical protein